LAFIIRIHHDARSMSNFYTAACWSMCTCETYLQFFLPQHIPQTFLQNLVFVAYASPTHFFQSTKEHQTYHITTNSTTLCPSNDRLRYALRLTDENHTRGFEQRHHTRAWSRGSPQPWVFIHNNPNLGSWYAGKQRNKHARPIRSTTKRCLSATPRVLDTICFAA